MAQQELKHKAWLIFPLLAFSINEDNSKEIVFGWFNKTWTIKW